jgi:hypothetical protein
MSNAIIMRTGSTISPSASPTEDRETGVADRRSEKSASVSSCSSQETVLGAGDVCSNRQLPTSAVKANGSWYDSSDGSLDPTRRLDNFNGDGGGEEVFYDEQPQMALMSPLVTRWRRAQCNGTAGKTDLRCNNNPPSPYAGGQFASGGRSVDSPSAGCRPGDHQMIDGYATFRGRKPVSSQSSSARNRNCNEPTSGISSQFDRSTSPTGIIGDGGGSGGGAARLQKLRTESRFTPSASPATTSSATKKPPNEGVDTKALQNLHQPWRRLNSRGGGETDIGAAHRPAGATARRRPARFRTLSVSRPLATAAASASSSLAAATTATRLAWVRRVAPTSTVVPSESRPSANCRCSTAFRLSCCSLIKRNNPVRHCRRRHRQQQRIVRRRGLRPRRRRRAIHRPRRLLDP